MYNNITKTRVKDHQAIVRVLNAVSSDGTYKDANEIAYQLGVLAAWIAREAKNHHNIAVELEQRTEAFKERELLKKIGKK